MSSGNVSSVSYSNGSFVINGQAVGLDTAMMMLQIDRTQQLDSQIADQMKEIQDRNQKLSALNNLLAEMRAAKAEGRDDDGNASSWSGKGSKQFSLEGTDGATRNIDQWMDYFGLTKTDVQYDAKAEKRDAQWDANIESVKGMVDSLNSDSQLDMIRLNSLIDKRNVAFETAKKVQDKVQQTQQKIVN